MTIQHIEKKFIEEQIMKIKVRKFLDKELERAGVSNIEIQRTPLMTRIIIEALNPGYIIGRKGKMINDISAKLKEKFGIENPQIVVLEVKDPNLEPRLVGKRAARYIEMGKKVRAILYRMLKRIIDAGAIGAEIVASGKIGAKGAKARSVKVSAGYIPKAGDVLSLVKEDLVEAKTKAGIIGILVRIVPPGTVFPDKKPKEELELPKVISSAGNKVNKQQKKEGAKKEEQKSKEEKKEEKKKPRAKHKPKPRAVKKENKEDKKEDKKE